MSDPALLHRPYLTALAAMGWDVEPARGADLQVAITDELVAILSLRPEDPAYVSMDVYFSADERDLAVGPRIAADLVWDLKGVKVSIFDEALVFSADALVAAPSTLPTVPHLVAVLPRMRSMVLGAVERYHVRIAETGVDGTSGTA